VVGSVVSPAAGVEMRRRWHTWLGTNLGVDRIFLMRKRLEEVLGACAASGLILSAARTWQSFPSAMPSSEKKTTLVSFVSYRTKGYGGVGYFVRGLGWRRGLLLGCGGLAR
jgi:hypothetical protein